MSFRKIFCIFTRHSELSFSKIMSCRKSWHRRSLPELTNSRDYSYNRQKSYHIRKKRREEKKSTEEIRFSNELPIAVQMLTKCHAESDAATDSQPIKSIDDKLMKLDEIINEYETALEQLEAKKMTFELPEPVSNVSFHSKNEEPAVIYGTADPTIPKSNVPCQGCGAILHCQDPAIPGYVPSQKFLVLPLKKLKETFCQRCVLMKSRNIALGVKLEAKDYAEIISKIRDVNGLVVLVVDLMDMPNSIFPGLAELVGPEKPIYLVGNKVDLLPKDKDGYLQYCKDVLVRMCKMSGIGRNRNIQHVSLVSGKTMYGIEELVTHMMKHWARQGDVYIIGCTNVGKSTLYNALLSSDYCKSTARDLLARATTCVWPGTTLNLLKFPIVDPTQWRLSLRAKRLLKEKTAEQEENKLRRSFLKNTKKLRYASLMGHLGITQEDKAKPLSDDDEMFSPVSYTFGEEGIVEERAGDHPEADFDPSMYTQSRWCYDTPGAVNAKQIINLCTQEELEILLMTKMLRPRSCVIKPGETLWLSGLSRVDYLEGSQSIYMTVLTSNRIPLHVIPTHEADEFYAKNAGTKELGIPLGDEERLGKLPPLKSIDYTLVGLGWKESMADLVLSSLGWVAVTARYNMEVQVRCFTPNRLGLFKRSPPLLPFAVNLRGKRIRGSPMYSVRQAKF